MCKLCFGGSSSSILFLKLRCFAFVYEPSIFWLYLISVLLVFCSLDA